MRHASNTPLSCIVSINSLMNFNVIVYYCNVSGWVSYLSKQRGQVYILDRFSFLSILAIFILSFLSFLILSATSLLEWDTPDSPIPKCAPISFSFLSVYPSAHYHEKSHDKMHPDSLFSGDKPCLILFI